MTKSMLFATGVKICKYIPHHDDVKKDFLYGIKNNNSDDGCRQASCHRVPKIEPIVFDKKENILSCKNAIQSVVFTTTSPDCSARVKQLDNTPTR